MTPFSETSDSSLSHSFSDRRSSEVVPIPPGVERRQFSNTYQELSPNGRELAFAMDEYKVRHRRRFITYDEMIHILAGLGYKKSQ